MKDKRLLPSLMALLLLACVIAFTSCSKEEEEIPEVFMDAGVLYMTIDFSSDMDNGVQWELEQDPAIFESEYIFLEDEGGDDGSNEVQSFTLYPKKAGTTILTFSSTEEDTVYTYECSIDENLEDITVNNKRGESGGKEVEAPELIVERN